MSFNKIILEKIESYANNFQLPELGVIRKTALFGFHLRDEEVERLKEQIEIAFRESYNNTYHKASVDAKWKQFKKANNL